MIERLIIDKSRCFSEIDDYESAGGYEALKGAVSMAPAALIDEMKRAGLRGRGGAGFPTGRKWEAAAADPASPKYLVCNADEGEPGTFKDRFLLENNPHLVIEGIILAGFAIKARAGYIYLRGEYPALLPLLEGVIAQARDRGYLSAATLGTEHDLELYVHKGAGAYICGEETALIESLEGKRGQPRSRPPYTVNKGFMKKPTIANNVETYANVPLLLSIGAEKYASIGTPESPGPKLFSVSGHVERPGVYELPMGVPLSELIYEHCGGGRGGKRIKAVIPGGLSTPVLKPDHLTCAMDFNTKCDSPMSIIGSGAVIAFDEDTCMVGVAHRIAAFFAHESCGKCTPCREGTDWIRAMLGRMESGVGVMEDMQTLRDVCNNILGNSFCALGDSAAISALSFIDAFEDEFTGHITGGGCGEACRP